MGVEMVAEVKKDPDAGEIGDCKNIDCLPEKCVTVAVPSRNVDSDDASVQNNKISIKEFLPVKIEYDDNRFKSSSSPCLNGSSPSTNQAFDREPETSADELDHLVLKDRLSRLIPKSCVEVKEEIRFNEQQLEVSRDQIYEAHGDSFPVVKIVAVGFSGESEQASGRPSGPSSNIEGSDIQSLVNIKVEPIYHELPGCCGRTSADASYEKFASVKSEFFTSCDEYEDVLDHMSLKERINLLLSGAGNCWDAHQLPKGMNFSLNISLGVKKPGLSYIGRRPCKRRRTATGSIETALEEDAPGLLHVLIDKGVMVDEIKLYGQMDDDDDLSMKEAFSELGEVVEKVSWRSSSYLKFSNLQSKKSERASYCLGFLLALVEQTRYLRFRKWPVEWGWCRDLLSFIFVFKRHNRIVLERPEYGFATYFFELADSFPIDWQIKRLVTAMKLTSCSRINLLENKPLRIGEDLSLGDARVLSDFGWVPNTGLGTMLNYYDRVVHDRMNETQKDFSEWRNKIRKLLIDGYDRGAIISAGAPNPTEP